MIRHRPLVLSRVPLKTTVEWWRIWTWVAVKRAWKPLSQSCPMEMRALCFKWGKRCAFRAARGSDGKSRRAVWLAWMMSPFGSRTRRPLDVAVLCVQGLSMVRKWLVHPESAMADCEVCVVSEPIELDKLSRGLLLHSDCHMTRLL